MPSLRPETESELQATYWESLDQMVARMDVISVNCPHTPSTFHLMNARRLKLMKPEAVIVNTSRGAGWAFSAWGGSGRRWRVGPAPSGCRSTTTIASA